MTRFACVLGLGLIGGAMAMAFGDELTSVGPGKPASTISVDRIEAKEIVIRDKTGVQRASLGVDGGNVVSFVASSGTSGTQFMLRVFPDGRGALIFRDASGVNRVAISVREDGRPNVTLSKEANVILQDGRGRNRLVLGASDEGLPYVTLYDEKSRATSVRPTDKDAGEWN